MYMVSIGHCKQWCPLDIVSIGHCVYWTWRPLDNGHGVQWTCCPLDIVSIGRYVHWTSCLMDITSNGHYICPLDITMSIGVQWCPLDMMSIGSNEQQYQNDANPQISFGDVVHWIHLNGSNGHHWIQWTCPLDSPMVSIGSNGHDDVHWTSSPNDMMSIGQSNDVHHVHWIQWTKLTTLKKVSPKFWPKGNINYLLTFVIILL